MKFALFLAAFLAVCSIAFSALARYGPPPPGKSGHCWTDSTGPLKDGEEKQIEGRCAKAICHKDRTAVIQTCGVAIGPDGKRIVADLSKPYPQCCKYNF